MLWLNPYTNEVLAEQNYQAMPLRQKTVFWLFPLHSGEAFDLTGRLLTIVLTVAGGGLWLKRKFRPRRKVI